MPLIQSPDTEVSLAKSMCHGIIRTADIREYCTLFSVSKVYTRKEGSGEWKLDTEKVPSDHLKPEYIYVTAATLEPTVRYWFKVGPLFDYHSLTLST
jgi:hypothetical protein